jgi:hypothetical protein
MSSSGIWRCVDHAWTDVPPFFTISIQRHIPEDSILHSHRSETSALTCFVVHYKLLIYQFHHTFKLCINAAHAFPRLVMKDMIPYNSTLTTSIYWRVCCEGAVTVKMKLPLCLCNYYYYYLLTAIGLMPGGSVYKGYTVNKEHSTPVSRKDDTTPRKHLSEWRCRSTHFPQQ